MGIGSAFGWALSAIDVSEKFSGLWLGIKRLGVARWWRNWRANILLEPLHHDVIHSARRLAGAFRHWDAEHLAAAEVAMQFCEACARSMAQLLALDPNHVHCCLKLICTGAEGQKQVGTMARSRPGDNRPAEIGPGFAHDVNTNTVWSVLLGGSDGRSTWTTDYTCFACNDLPRHRSEFCCDRQRWEVYYKAAVVVPIRFCKSPTDDMGYVGFLAFDSPRVGAFGNIPDIFEMRDEPAEYKRLLRKSAAFNLAAMLSDVLGSFLGPLYDANHATRIELWTKRK